MKMKAAKIHNSYKSWSHKSHKFKKIKAKIIKIQIRRKIKAMSSNLDEVEVY
jgi:hypothetical protein